MSGEIAGRTLGIIGLGHMRWATHGRPSEENAHPHTCCKDKIVVVHNGIIENFRELRDGLEKTGTSFSSDTDTEVVAHLVTQELQTGCTPAQAV